MAVLIAAQLYSLHLIVPFTLEAVSSQPSGSPARWALRHLGMFSHVSMPFFTRVRRAGHVADRAVIDHYVTSATLIPEPTLTAMKIHIIRC